MSRQGEAGGEIPWFLHTYFDPPTDPLTLQLLALVEDLPSVPGPQTVGSENYSRIFKAFKTTGWRGFEEEFDQIVPRERPDYEDVKRELLREPLFNLKGHRRMLEASLGLKTADEIFAEMHPRGEQEPE